MPAVFVPAGDKDQDMAADPGPYFTCQPLKIFSGV